MAEMAGSGGRKMETTVLEQQLKKREKNRQTKKEEKHSPRYLAIFGGLLCKVYDYLTTMLFI